MAAVYPDMFAAASEFSGEPAGCFYTGTVRGWNSQCANGQVKKSPSEWASTVRAMYPGYTGQYPRMQIFHGDVDNILNINSYNESIKEWSGIFGYSGNPSSALNNNPGSRLTKYIYGDRLQGIWGHGFGHVVPTNETEALQWFGILVSIQSIVSRDMCSAKLTPHSLRNLTHRQRLQGQHQRQRGPVQYLQRLLVEVAASAPPNGLNVAVKIGLGQHAANQAVPASLKTSGTPSAFEEDEAYLICIEQEGKLPIVDYWS